MKKTWKAQTIQYMKSLYGKNVERYAKEMEVDGKRNDRQVYINIYNMIMEALDTMPEEPNTYIAVAVDHLIHEDVETMKRINKHFTGKEF